MSTNQLSSESRRKGIPISLASFRNLSSLITTTEVNLHFLPLKFQVEKGIYDFEHNDFFSNLCTFVLLTSTIVPDIDYFVVITHPLHQVTGSEEEK